MPGEKTCDGSMFVGEGVVKEVPGDVEEQAEKLFFTREKQRGWRNGENTFSRAVVQYNLVSGANFQNYCH